MWGFILIREFCPKVCLEASVSGWVRQRSHRRPDLFEGGSIARTANR
nr:MAG TPA: hypothetical protein [Caudoviricetes sp.]